MNFFTLNEIFLKNCLQIFVALIFTLLSKPFESKLVNYSTRCRSLKTSMKSLIHRFCFEAKNGTKVELSRFFKDSLQPWLLTYFESKCTKRSVNIWATNVYKVFFKNISFNLNRRPSKIRSLHTCGVLWIHWCVVNCR